MFDVLHYSRELRRIYRYTVCTDDKCMYNNMCIVDTIYNTYIILNYIYT